MLYVLASDRIFSTNHLVLSCGYGYQSNKCRYYASISRLGSKNYGPRYYPGGSALFEKENSISPDLISKVRHLTISATNDDGPPEIGQCEYLAHSASTINAFVTQCRQLHTLHIRYSAAFEQRLPYSGLPIQLLQEIVTPLGVKNVEITTLFYFPSPLHNIIPRHHFLSSPFLGEFRSEHLGPSDDLVCILSKKFEDHLKGALCQQKGSRVMAFIRGAHYREVFDMERLFYYQEEEKRNALIRGTIGDDRDLGYANERGWYWK